MENVKYKICYWYAEWEDMGARVPTCDYYKQYGKCPCELECEHFITKTEVDDIVRNMGKIGQMSDLISRQDALSPFCVAPDGTRIPEVDCDNFPVEFSVEFIKKHLLSLPSIEPRVDLISRADAIELCAEAQGRASTKSELKGISKVWQGLLKLPSAEAVPQSEQYKKGFEDAKRAFELEFAREAESIRKQNAQLEVMLNIQKALLAERNWIPCSESLPSESGDYLCTIPLDADETYTEVLTFHKGKFYEDDDEWGATYHDDVLAWMPLPIPYKGGDDK